MMLRPWTRRAACADYPPQWWEVHDKGPLTVDNRRAREICRTCPAFADCAADSDEIGPRYRCLVILAGTPHNARGYARSIEGEASTQPRRRAVTKRRPTQPVPPPGSPMSWHEPAEAIV